jgi:hypothetical protein
MKVLAIGPRTAATSWEWVGLGMADELRAYFDVVLFEGFDEVPAADLILIVKQRPPADFLATAKARGMKIYFAPIDVYRDPSEIAADAAMLGGCEVVLIHSEALRPALEPFCREIALVEHHARFALDRLADFKTDGFLLWIGAFQHVPQVLHWLDRHPSPIEVRLLSDLDTRSARIAGHVEARRLGLSLRIRDGLINGHPAERWSETAQANLMQSCKAAIDIKGSDFNQVTKPPTKAQQFVASGVPFGCNPGHPAMAYFRARGFEPADGSDFDRLLSQAYWQETQRFAGRLREWTSLDAVGRAYRHILAPGDPASARPQDEKTEASRPCGS